MSSPCLACAPALICSDPADLAPTGGYYATQDYIEVVNCPPGYKCQFGSARRTIIHKVGIPKVPRIPGTTTLTLKGCLYVITRTLALDATQAEFEAAAASMQAEWAAQQAQCQPPNTPDNPYPPPTPRNPNRPVCVNVENTVQSYTANCPNPGCGPPVTRSTAAGTYQQLECNPTLVAAVQAALNAQALADATAAANGALSCTGGNSFLASTGFCASNPLIWFHAEIPECTYDGGGDVLLANAQASADLNAQIKAGLIALGCTCPGPTPPAAGYGFIPGTPGCTYYYAWNRNSPFLIGIGPSGFDPAAAFYAFNYYVLHGTSILTPYGWAGPTITQEYP